MFRGEIWKPVREYEGLYSVSSKGRLYNCKTGKFIGSTDNDGYIDVTLYKDGKKIRKSIHRLVYEAFVGDIPNGFQIHHKNHIRNDNRIENLELIDGYKHRSLHRSKKIVQYSINMEYIKEYESITKASLETGIDKSNINQCCQNKRKTAGGFLWKYKK